MTNMKEILATNMDMDEHSQEKSRRQAEVGVKNNFPNVC